MTVLPRRCLLLAGVIAHAGAHHAAPSGRSAGVRLAPGRPLCLRGGAGDGAPTSAVAPLGLERPTQQSYYDVDGTLYDGTMAHCGAHGLGSACPCKPCGVKLVTPLTHMCVSRLGTRAGWWFLCALPSPLQKLSKMIQFCVALPFVGTLAAVDEGRAAECLGRLLVRGVRASDAKCAAEAVADGILSHAYPEVIEHLQRQQSEGRETILLSGNIEPLLWPLAARLRCRVVGTCMEEVEGRFSGNVIGPVCVLEGKRQKLLESMNPHVRARKVEERSGLVGCGNSVYDVPFLNEVPHAFVVRPSARLRRIAIDKGWDLSFHNVRGSGVCLTGRKLLGGRRLQVRARKRERESVRRRESVRV